jgi:hypothetical protein
VKGAGAERAGVLARIHTAERKAYLGVPSVNSLALVTLGFLAGEHAFAPLLFLPVAELHGEGLTRRAGLRLLPYALIAAGYAFIFRADMDDPHYLFTYPTKQGLVRLSLPRIGETKRLSAPAWPR